MILKLFQLGNIFIDEIDFIARPLALGRGLSRCLLDWADRLDHLALQHPLLVLPEISRPSHTVVQMLDGS